MNVHPFQHSGDSGNLHSVHTNFFGDMRIWNPRFRNSTDVPHKVWIKFRPRECVSFCLPVLAYFVGIICSLISKEKMARIATFGIVAFVKDMFSIGNRSVLKFVAYSMGRFPFVLNEHHPISADHSAPLPWPARFLIPDVHARPKSGFPIFPPECCALRRLLGMLPFFHSMEVNEL